MEYQTPEWTERNLKPEMRLLDSVRKGLGLRKSEFALELGISFETYSRWLHCKTTASDDSWKSVCGRVQKLLSE